jgi:queuosine precursor transporter
MIHNILKDKSTRLFLILSGFFVANALVAEFMGVKLFSLEETFGFKPAEIMYDGVPYSFTLTCGVILWPVVFIMTDIINEYYGPKGVRMLSWMAVVLIGYGFIMLFGAIGTTPAGWWVTSKQNAGVEDMNKAYNAIFGQGLGIIVGSMCAFMLGQLLDVYIFHSIKRRTGEKYIWLRATGSTLVSQFIDSFVVVFIAFYLYPTLVSNQGAVMPIGKVLFLSCISYAYKFVMALLLTPVIYGVHKLIDRYLGHSLAAEMKKAAMAGS